MDRVLILTIESKIGASRIWSRHVTRDVDWQEAPTSESANLVFLDQARSVIEDEFTDGVVGVVVDLSQLPWISSTGLGLIVAWHNAAIAIGREIVLAAPSKRVANTLEKVQLKRVVPVLGSVREACERIFSQE